MVKLNPVFVSLSNTAPQIQDSNEVFWKLPWRPLLSSVHFWKHQYTSEQQMTLNLPSFLETG